MAADSEVYLLVVPGGGLDAVCSELERHRLIGWAIEGSQLGHDGHVLALVAGEEGRRAWVADGDRIGDVDLDDVLHSLCRRWPGTSVDPETIRGARVVGPVPASARLEFGTVAVLPFEELMLGVVAHSASVTIEKARVDDRYVVGMASSEEVPDDFLDVAASLAKGPGVVLWRRGPCLGLAVHDRGELQQVHWWVPDWIPVGGDDHPSIRDAFGTPRGDAAEIARLVERQDDVVTIRALMRRSSPPVDEVLSTLGLPIEALDVLEGRTTVAELPGGSVVEATSAWAAMMGAARASEHDPAWVRWFDAGARELRPWYVVASILSIIAGVALAGQWVAGGSRFFGVVGVVMASVTAIDLPVRWWLKHRR